MSSWQFHTWWWLRTLVWSKAFFLLHWLPCGSEPFRFLHAATFSWHSIRSLNELKRTIFISKKAFCRSASKEKTTVTMANGSVWSSNYLLLQPLGDLLSPISATLARGTGIVFCKLYLSFSLWSHISVLKRSLTDLTTPSMAYKSDQLVNLISYFLAHLLDGVWHGGAHHEGARSLPQRCRASAQPYRDLWIITLSLGWLQKFTLPE